MGINQTKKFGVKLQVISSMDSIDLENITEAIRLLGYDITYCDNGNIVCESTERVKQT